MSFQQIDHLDNQRPEGKTCLLIYGYDALALNSIKKYAADMGLDDIIEVKKDQTSNTLRQLIEGTGNLSTKAEAPASPAIVLNAVSNAELNGFVHNFKTLGLPRCLFAMVTPTSINWQFKELIKDLLEERAMFEKMRREQLSQQ